MDWERLWEMGARGLEELQAVHGFDASERATGRYSALFGRDSLWMLLLLLEAERLRPSEPFSEWVRESCGRILSALCDLQGSAENDDTEEQPGKIVHEYHREVDPHVVGSGMPLDKGRSYGGFDQTFLFVSAFRRFADRFRSDPLPARRWSHLERALAWMQRYGDDDGDGLFEYRRRHPANLLNEVWKDSFDSATHTGFDVPPQPLAWIEVQGYAYRALLDASDLYRGRGDDTTARDLSSRAEALRELVDRRFWLADEAYVALALDREKTPVRMAGSNAGHALWAGLLLPHRDEPVIRRLFKPDLMTPLGLRTLSASSRFYAPFAYHRGSVWPFDNAVFAWALRDRARWNEARKVMEAVGSALLWIGTPIETYVVLDGDVVVGGNLSDPPILAYHQVVRADAGAPAVPQNQIQGWTAAAALFFAAAMGENG